MFKNMKPTLSLLLFIGAIKLNGENMDTTKYSKAIAKSTVDRYTSIERSIYYASDMYDTPSWIISSLLFMESRFNNDSRSSTGVTGIAMITSSTAKHFGIDKSTAIGQINGMAKILRHAYDNLPEYYSDNDRWHIAALIYNGGKSPYWKAKRRATRRGITGSKISIDIIVNGYKNEARKYYHELLKVEKMFNG